MMIATQALNDCGAWETIEIEDAGSIANAADLEAMVDLSAQDLGCEPGTEHRVDLVDDGTVVATIYVTAS